MLTGMPAAAIVGCCQVDRLLQASAEAAADSSAVGLCVVALLLRLSTLQERVQDGGRQMRQPYTARSRENRVSTCLVASNVIQVTRHPLAERVGQVAQVDSGIAMSKQP